MLMLFARSLHPATAGHSCSPLVTNTPIYCCSLSKNVLSRPDRRSSTPSSSSEKTSRGRPAPDCDAFICIDVPVNHGLGRTLPATDELAIARRYGLRLQASDFTRTGIDPHCSSHAILAL